MKLIIDYNDFIKELNRLLVKGNELYNKNNTTKENNFDSVKEEIKEWENTVFNYLNWIFRSYCATYSGHIVPRETDIISRPNLHINL